ncbi:MAG: HlyD family secretion protein [Oceanospirillaceae bacterium]|nr:HlyD family secretion protein [Oceanospirillaceae bacterium]
MSDNEKLPEEVEDRAAEPTDAARPVRRGGQLIGLIIIASLVWYLLADRFTPYTDQARVQGYVVGVAPKVSGIVTQVWIGNNQRVKAGQKLFEIDPSQYQIALNKARSDLENARNQVQAGNAAVDAARANLRAATANRLKAEQDFERLTRLRRQDPGTISIRRLEVAQATLEQASAQVQAAEADIQRAIEAKGGDTDELNAILNTAQTAVDKAELDLADTIVTAETDGMVTDLRADVGVFAGAGKPVMTMIAFNDVWISAEFTENNLGHLAAGSPVEILFDSMPGEVFAGSIRSIGVGVSAGQAPPAGTLPTVQNSRDWLRQSQRFPVVVGFDVAENPDLLKQLRIGGQASVIAYSEGHGLLAILGRLYIRLMSWLSYAY